MLSRNLDTIRDNPKWMPHRLLLQKSEVEFVRMPASQFGKAGFLFEYQPAEPADTLRIALGSLSALSVPRAPMHFIFHTAFCRSTLLVRALNIPGVATGFSEPPILADLTSAGKDGVPFIQPLLHLLARAWPEGGTIFVKPTNHANRLIPQLLDAVPDARAILMTNPIEPFLRSVRKRGLMGHRWGRKLYLELQGYAGMDFGMPPEEVFAMTDLQAAGAAWLLNQRYFTELASSRFSDRLKVLDGDYFDENRAKTIDAVLAFCGAAPAHELLQYKVFSAHAKSGKPIEKQGEDEIGVEEIVQVKQWVEMIAGQIGLTVPTAQTLL